MGEQNMKKEMAKLPSLFDGGRKVEGIKSTKATVNKAAYDEYASFAKFQTNKKEVDPFKGFVVKPNGQKTCPNFFAN